MRMLTVRLPDALGAAIEAEAGVAPVFRALSNPDRLKIDRQIRKAAARAKKGITLSGSALSSR